MKMDVLNVCGELACANIICPLRSIHPHPTSDEYREPGMIGNPYNNSTRNGCIRAQSVNVHVYTYMRIQGYKPKKKKKKQEQIVHVHTHHLHIHSRARTHTHTQTCLWKYE